MLRLARARARARAAAARAAAGGGRRRAMWARRPGQQADWRRRGTGQAPEGLPEPPGGPPMATGGGGGGGGGEGTFVSAHYRVDAADVMGYLRRKRLLVREAAPGVVAVKECPMCPPTKGKADNMWKLHVWTDHGGFFCHRCGSKGSWFDLKRRLGDLAELTTVGGAPAGGGGGGGGGGVPSGGGRGGAVGRAGPAKGASKAEPKRPDEARVTEFPANLERPGFREVWDVLTSTGTVRVRLPGGNDGFAYVQGRGLSPEVLRKYGVGATRCKFPGDGGRWTEHACVTFPWTRLEARPPAKKGAAAAGSTPPLPYAVDRVKLRSVPAKRFQQLYPAGGAWGLFGWHTIPQGADELVLTEGEYDALAVHQATGLPAVSLPNGARSLPVELLPCLERFRRIYLWMDNDVPGQEGADTFARKLGIGRCSVVRSRPLLAEGVAGAGADAATAPKDANEALLQALALKDPAERERALADMRELIAGAEPLKHKQITRFSSLRQEIFREFAEPRAVQGIQSTTLPSLNRLLKGHRRGELTVLTGPTGGGKTTLLSQLSLDYCDSGANTLWGSFEIKNSRLAKSMLRQYAGVDFERDLHQFDLWADRFQELPMFFLRFFGSSDVEQVLDAMEYAVYVHDVEHIVLDNLQFMLSGQSRSGIDKFDHQDRAIERFRNFATKHNVHVTLVIHPRKEAERQSLGMNSVFGSAKATQEADNVVILQHVAGPDGDASKEYRVLEVKKNRFDGDVGSVPLRYDRATHRLVECPQEELDAVRAGNAAPARQGGGGGGGAPARPNPIAGAAGRAAPPPKKKPAPPAAPARQKAQEPAPEPSALFEPAPKLAFDVLFADDDEDGLENAKQ